MHSPETKAKISQSKKGQRCSVKTEFKKGFTPWNKGIKKRTNTGKTHFKKGVGFWTGKKRPNMSGTNNPNSGKFGKSHPVFREIKQHSFYKSIRETYRYRQWRSGVFTNDEFTCVECNVRGGELQADHIKRFIDIINEFNIKTLDEAIVCEELWDIKNGRTLCVTCHRKTDTWGKKRKIK